MVPFFQHIAVPLDASGAALAAYRMAELMHTRFKSKLSVIHVSEGEGDSLVKVKTLVDDRAKAGIPINLELRTGSIYKNIVKAADDLQADLMILGTHGAFGFQAFWMGSNAYRVVSSAHCPTITVQEHVPRNDIKTIVLPIDTSAETRQKVPMAALMAKNFDATIHILGVSTDRDDEAQRYVKLYSNQVEEYLEKNGIAFVREQRMGGNITQNTIAYGKEVNADLIIIMTEQEPNGSAFFMGKFAQQMVHQSPIPVMSVKPRA